MSVAVYPRLSAFLEERHLSVDDLGRQIAERYGITVDPETLQGLMQAAPVERIDLAAIGATAAVLGIGLDDLFSVYALPELPEPELPEPELPEPELPEPELPEPEPLLSPEKSRRLDELFDRQDDELLIPDEHVEMETLVKDLGRALYERGVHQFANRNGISVEQAQHQMAADLAQAVDWWRQVEADPELRRAVIAASKDLAPASSAQ